MSRIGLQTVNYLQTTYLQATNVQSSFPHNLWDSLFINYIDLRNHDHSLWKLKKGIKFLYFNKNLKFSIYVPYLL